MVLFIHGFMGFKDWGAWNLVQEYFCSHNFGFCKFNLSHNGGTKENGIDFPDESAFAENRYSYEVNDTGLVIDWLINKVSDIKNVHLIGHSRGGAIAILKGFEDLRVSSITTWASISSIGNRFPSGIELEDWKKSGIRHIKNSRTNQLLPQKYTLYSDFKENESYFDLEKKCKSLAKPICIIHGTLDQSVAIDESEKLSAWSTKTMFKIKDADHVFMTRHPWINDALSDELEEACFITLQFLLQNFN